MTDEHGDDSSTPVAVRSWSELQRRFDQVDNHVRQSTDKIEKLTDRIHAIETQLAGGPQFPLWAKGMVATILLQTGAAFWWAGSVDQQVSMVPDLSARLTSAFQGMRNSDLTVQRMEDEHLRISAAVDALVKKAMENQERSITCCADVAVLRERCLSMTERLETQEKRAGERDKWWQAVWASGIIKGLKQ